MASTMIYKNHKHGIECDMRGLSRERERGERDNKSRGKKGRGTMIVISDSDRVNLL